MKNEMEVKSHVLDMLKEMLMGTDGGKFKPKMVSMEIVIPKKGGDKAGLEDLLKEASEDNPVEHEEPDGDEYCDGGMVDDEEEKPKMSLKDFLKSRK